MRKAGCFALKPTATNLTKAEQHKAAIVPAISIGTFDYSVTFPGSARAAKFAPEALHETVAGFLTRWLAVKKSTSPAVPTTAIARSSSTAWFPRLAST